MNTERTCAHDGCSCPVEEGKTYCSEECRAAETEKRSGGCGCEHSGCAR